MSLFKYIGCILLVISCMIGGGVLALPIICNSLGIVSTAVIMIVAYIIMSYSGILALECSAKLPVYQNNFATIAEKTLGKFGKLVVTVAFCITLYTALTAYISASPDIITNTILTTHIAHENQYLSLLFTLILGAIITTSLRYSEILNRYMMFLKLGALVLVIMFFIGYIASVDIYDGEFDIYYLPKALSVIVLAFSYQSIVPSLVNYAGKENIKQIRNIIIIATTITCLLYLLWVCTVTGLLDSRGVSSSKDLTLAELTKIINTHSGSMFTPVLLKFFLNITLVTSFISLSIAFLDFWIDLLRLSYNPKGKLIAAGLAFVPPWLIANYFDNIFVNALAIAGFAGLVFALFLPSIASYKMYEDDGVLFMRGRSIRLVMVVISVFAIILTAVGSVL